MANFGRKIKVQIGKRGEQGIEISGLRIDFTVEKNEESNPNKSKITIYNLSRDTISRIEESEEIYLYVGYVSTDTEYLFLYGDIDTSQTYRSGADILTEIYIEEGKDEFEQAYFSKAYASKTSKKQIILDAVDSLGLSTVIDKKKIEASLSVIDGIDEKLENGSAFSKKTKDMLDYLFDLIGLKYSIQNGEFIVLGPSQFVDNQEYLINANNGMIGVPTRTQKKESNKNNKSSKNQTNGADVKVVLLPELRIGTKIRLESEFIKGIFKVQTFSAIGSNFTNSWEMDLKTIEVK